MQHFHTSAHFEDHVQILYRHRNVCCLSHPPKLFCDSMRVTSVGTCVCLRSVWAVDSPDNPPPKITTRKGIGNQLDIFFFRFCSFFFVILFFSIILFLNDDEKISTLLIFLKNKYIIP